MNPCVNTSFGIPARGFAVVYPLPHNMTPRVLKGDNGTPASTNVNCMERIDRLDMRRRIECLSDVDAMLNNEDFCNRHPLLVRQLKEYLDRHERPSTAHRSDILGVRDILANYDNIRDTICGRRRGAEDSDDPILTFINVDINIDDGDFQPIYTGKRPKKPGEWVEFPGGRMRLPPGWDKPEDGKPHVDVTRPPAKGPDGYIDERPPVIPQPMKDPDEYNDVREAREAHETRLREDEIVDRGHRAQDRSPEALRALSCSENVCKTKLRDSSSGTLTRMQNGAFFVIGNQNATLEERLDAICTLKCVAVTDRLREENIVNRLAAYVRRRVPWYIPQAGDEGPVIRPLRPDVQAAMFVIAGADRAPVSRKIDLRGTDLRGANLRRSNLADIDFAGANLSAVDFGQAVGVDGWENIYLITIDETTRIPPSIYAGFTPTRSPHVPQQPMGSFNITTSDWIWWQVVPVNRNMSPIPTPPARPVVIEEFELIIPSTPPRARPPQQETILPLVNDSPGSLLPIRKEEIK